jgi:hypothetical protein
MNVWDTTVQVWDEFSLTQMWATANSTSGLQTVEAGVNVANFMYDDDYAHFFIYDTQDGYDQTGCYNNLCDDFVQVSSTLYPGDIFASASVEGGYQSESYPWWFKDGENGHWWLLYGWEELEPVGFYPSAWYDSPGLYYHATQLQFGGEIWNDQTGGSHTQTDMGSGHFSDAGYTYASYQAWLQSFSDSSGSLSHLTDMIVSATDVNCYDIDYHDDYNDPYFETFFFFGGPGYDATNCY